MTAPQASAPRETTPGHRVLLVREWEGQHTGSGCCGKIGGADSEIDSRGEFAHTRCRMERIGEVYRALRSELRGTADVQIVDPRNTVFLVPAIWRDARRHGASRGAALRAVTRGTADGAIVADGRVLFTGDPPAPSDAVDAVLATLA